MSLPSGYKRLEYIQSTGTQYIDTKFKPNENTRVLADCSLLGGTYPTAFGAWTSASKDMVIVLALTANSARIYYASQEKDLSVSIMNRHILDFDAGTFRVDGTNISSFAKSNFQCSNSIYLFTFHGGETQGSFKTTARYYNCKIYDNGILARDFVPCKNASGTVGLYDTVNGQFYANAGTGTFTAGPEVGVATPENFRLSSSTENTATLAWSAVDGATGYKLYRDGILIATLTDTGYTDTIQPFTSYIYTLTAYNDSGESDPASISVQIIIPPETPSNFRASSASMTAISLAWDAVTGADSYQLKRNGSVIYSGEGTSYTDSGLTAETAYTYTLSAVNTAGSSAETTLEVATTQLILVTDRTAADVAAQNAKGTYNTDDLNRVGAAVRYVADLFHGLGYGFSVSPKTDWKETDWPTPSDMERYLQDVSTLRGLLAQLDTTPNVPKSMAKLTHWTANDIEQILMDLDDSITRMEAAMFYAGEIYSGEESI